MDGTLSAHIDAALRRRAGRTAVVAGGVVLSGDALLRRSDELAIAIGSHGVRPGDVVAVMADRSVDTLAAILAILRLECAYLPLEPDVPAAWQHHLIDLSGAGCVVRAAGSTVVELGAALSGRPVAVVRAEYPAGARRLAYVMGTSGTTGTPKAVPVTEASLLQYCTAFAGRVGGETEFAGLRMASVTTLAADLGNTMIFPALLFGGELHLVPRNTAREPQRFARYMRQHRIDALKIVPTHLRALLQSGLAVLPLRLLVVGGEPFDLDLLERLEVAEPTCAVFNHYGPTETTIGVTMRQVDTSPGASARLRAEGRHAVPVGTALGATQLHVVDAALDPCPAGQVGELLIGGPGVADGYLGDPSETDRRFVITRWSRERVFRSGDRARRMADGEVELLGRIDRQLKIRGHRVEPAAVESMLRAHPAVNDAYVAMRDLGDLGPALVAWTSPASDAGEAALRQFLRDRLPAATVPSRIVPLVALPRTANGKVDERALPNPLAGLRPPPPTGGEDLVRQVFAEVLSLPYEETGDDFFRLGGHSLAALRALTRLHDEHGLQVPAEAFFADAHPAAVLRAARPAPPRDAGTAAGPPSPGLSPQVRSLWTHLQLNPGDTAYEVPLRLHVTGPTSAGQIRAALTRFVARHAALRTRIVVVDGEPAPALDPTPAVTLRFDEHTMLDVEAGPLMRATVNHIGGSEHRVDLLVHHIAFDGVSQSVLVRELAADLSHEPLRLPAAAPASPRPVARGLPLGTGASAQFGLEPAAPSSDAPARCHVRDLAAELWRLVESRAIEFGTTPFALLAAAWATVLSKQAGEPAVTIGTPADLREGRAGDWQPVGYHVNVVVLELHIEERDTVRDLITLARSAVGRALAGRARPYADLVADQRAATSTAPTRTLLTVERTERAAAARVEVRQEPVHAPRPMLGVDCCVVIDGDHVTVQVHHRTDVCPPWRAAVLAEQLEHVLDQFVADPGRQIARIALTPAAWAARLQTWSSGGTAQPIERWGVHGFLTHAQEGPAATALLWPGGRWTRQRLATEVERATQTLAGHGVGPGHVVVLDAAPSPAAVITWFAAGLLGAAALGIDPAWPAPRRRSAVELARPTAVVSSPDGLQLVIERQPSGPQRHPEELAYLVLTSGSTGTPKMAAIQRSALVNELSWFATEFPVGPDDCVLAHTSPGFDVAVWEMLGPLAWGARLVFPSVSRRNDIPHLAALISENAVTVVQTVPSLLEALLDEDDVVRSPPRLILCGGEEMPPRLAAEVLDRLPGVTLVNMYGPSETAIDATFCRVDRETAAGRRIPVGRPIAGVRTYVLDGQLRLQPPGAFGQLAVAGAAVGSGYLGDAAATAQRFVPDPHGAEPGARLYLTGDRARWDGTGRLEFGGRLDNQVKVRGNRVELEEVEAVIRALPMVDDAVVVLVEPGTRHARLAALVVPQHGAQLSIRQLHEHASRVLPSYMVPSSFGILQALPRLANGKVARHALPLDVLQAPVYGVRWRTQLEGVVAGVWTTLLNHPVAAADLSFFAAGGTSLLIPKLRQLLANEVGVMLSVPELFEHPTVHAQSRLLEQRLAGTDAETPVVSQRGLLRRKALAARQHRNRL
ncbi:non-ribosomal peptide synthetase [Salinispora fenicalii]|uniref:non-ribosomal peptide synthetase n=1 Tax=Salinispora fenicalii TaxID=1137263 RepID=UPI0004B45E54|nr:non-ribosomal peptide synthetase [Salinispora fenicalii]